MSRILRSSLFLSAALLIPACVRVAPSTIANAPSNLQVDPAGTTTSRIRLIWTDESVNEFEFRIERSDNLGATFAQVGSVPKNTTVFDDLGLLAGTTYQYRVAAWNSKGYSGYAGPVSASTLGLNWTGPQSGGPLSGRGDHSAIYDSSPTGQRMIVFGGLDVANGGILSTEIWSLGLSDPVSPGPWIQLSATTQPPGLQVPGLLGHSAIYDSVHNRMVVFGGQMVDAMNNLVNSSDVYVLDLVSLVWTKPAVTGTPPSGRSYHKAVYDPMREQMIVQGGYDGSVELATTYALSLSSTGAYAWSGPLPSGPVRRQQHSAIRDPLGDRVIVFGGLDNDLSDGSVLNQDSWSLSPGPPEFWSELLFTSTPGFRFGHSGDYDGANQRMVIFGGQTDVSFSPTLSSDLWAMDLHATPSWSLLGPVGPVPPGRISHTVVYDAANRRLVIYGGYDANFVPFDDLWVIQL